jgi:hypothetical protein
MRSVPRPGLSLIIIVVDVNFSTSRRRRSVVAAAVKDPLRPSQDRARLSVTLHANCTASDKFSSIKELMERRKKVIRLKMLSTRRARREEQLFGFSRRVITCRRIFI